MADDAYVTWCTRRVEVEESFKAEGCPMDVWPAGWSSEQIEAARKVGREALAEGADVAPAAAEVAQ